MWRDGGKSGKQKGRKERNQGEKKKETIGMSDEFLFLVLYLLCKQESEVKRKIII